MVAGQKRSGITARAYKNGSVVYFEGDRSEYIYILKSGRVILTYLKPESGEEVKEEVKPGEFFGVKSALGRYPREETAQTFGDIEVLVLTVADFERLVLGNLNVVKKMLRVFSNQLRRIGKAVREVLGDTNVVNPEVELYKIGEYYFKNGKYNQAVYAYKKFMEYYPDSKFAANCMKKIKDIQSGNVSAPVEETPVASATDAPSFDEDFGIEEPVADGLEDGLGDGFDDDLPEDMQFAANQPTEDLTDFDFDDSTDDTTGIGSEMDDFLNS